MKVNFMVIGAMKSGTTTLSEIFRRHPDIEFREKELNFFARTKNWREDIGKYEGAFKSTGKLRGESSTHYTYYPEFRLGIWKDIHEYNPEMKLIYVVRDPVERAISQYMHMYERGYLDASIEEALRTEPSIINNGRYYTQIKPYIELFGKERLLILDFDDLMKRRESVLAEISRFLGIDQSRFTAFGEVHANVTIGGGKWHHKFDNLKRNLNRFRGFFPKKFRNRVWDMITGRSRRAFTKKPTLSPEWRDVILRLSWLDIVELERFTGKDFTKWFTKHNVTR